MPDTVVQPAGSSHNAGRPRPAATFFFCHLPICSWQLRMLRRASSGSTAPGAARVSVEPIERHLACIPAGLSHRGVVTDNNNFTSELSRT